MVIEVTVDGGEAEGIIVVMGVVNTEAMVRVRNFLTVKSSSRCTLLAIDRAL